MKKLIIFCSYMYAISSFGYAIWEENPIGMLENCEQSFQECISTTTFFPTVLVVDQSQLGNDDTLIKLSDEVNGEVSSQEMINQYALHFQVTTDQVIEAVQSLQNSNEGLSFENLNSILK